MFELPIKGDIDRTLSNLMHDARHRLMIEKNRITAEAAQAGALQGNRVIVTVASFADQIHDASMKQATPILLDFIERMRLPPAEITEWARPHLENLGNSLLGIIPPNNFPADHQRIVAQYRALFQQRLDGVLRDVEIGFEKGAGFARAEQVESKEEWISAAAALTLLKPVLGEYTAMLTIAERANDEVIRSRAARLVVKHPDKKALVEQNCEVPSLFWWARGNAALKQNWAAGDFETWVGQTIHFRAYGVSFLRSEISQIVPADLSVEPARAPAPDSAKRGGRPPADWWEDLLIETCFRHFRGELQAKTQADIARAMQEWITERGYEAADSTVRIRARKVWNTIQRDAEN
jgi:hypothetical protein